MGVRPNIQKPCDASSALFTMPKKFATSGIFALVPQLVWTNGNPAALSDKCAEADDGFWIITHAYDQMEIGLL
jgi:hypothetical protein